MKLASCTLVAALLILMAAVAAAKPISIRADFAGGSLGRVEQVTVTHFRCAVKGERDHEGRNRQASWYYFRIDGARGRLLTIDLVDLPGEYNYRPNRGPITQATLPWYSVDRRRWTPLATAEYQAETPLLRLRLTPSANSIWLAHVPPYTNEDLQPLLREFKQHPALQQQVIGKSVAGRDILLLTVTDKQAAATLAPVVWLMFRQHSWEAGSSWAGEGALRFLLSRDPLAVRMRREVVFKIFPLCDPDGVARGGVRFNAHGYDLNRNWDAVDEKKMPEIAAQRRAVLEWVDGGRRIDLFLTLHNTETSEYFDGPPDSDGRHRGLTERLFKLLAESETFAPTRPPQPVATSTTPERPGRMTVVQGLYHERRLPACLIELMITKHPKLNRQPTIADRQRFGAELVQILWRAVMP